MRFFNVDQHISGPADVKRIFRDFGHSVTDWCLSGHAGVMGRSNENVPLLNGENWCRLACQDTWKEFYDQYKDEFSQYDAFYVFYPPVFIRLYEWWNKPILLQVPIRFDTGMHRNAENIARFFAACKQPDVTMTANSKYDQAYLKNFCTELEVEHIPNLCEYTGMRWTGKNRRILYYATRPHGRMNTLMPGMLTRKENTLSAGHTWQEVADFLAIVHLPYQVSTMSIFEQYTACIPLFLPSKRFMLELYETEGTVLEHYSTFKLAGHDSKSVAESTGKYDPNDYKNMEAVAHWLDYADYYDETWMPHIQYFDSFEELKEKLNDTDFAEVSNKMAVANGKRKQWVYERWGKVLKRVEARFET